MTCQIRSIELPTGVTLQYVETGNSSGTPVLLLHGLSDSWLSFKLVLPYLPDSIRAIALSQRGHGDSSRPVEGYAARDFVADLAGFMDAMHLKAAVIVGHSMGSFAARRFAVDYPERTLGLVLIGSFSVEDNPGVAEVQGMVSAMTDPVDPELIRGFQESTTAKPVPQEFLESVVQESQKLPARVWRDAVSSVAEDDSGTKLNKITAPTLIVAGERDALCPREGQEALAAAVPDARLLVYPDTGHGVHWEEPERFASDLVAFVQAIGS